MGGGWVVGGGWVMGGGWVVGDYVGVSCCRGWVAPAANLHTAAVICFSPLYRPALAYFESTTSMPVLC